MTRKSIFSAAAIMLAGAAFAAGAVSPAAAAGNDPAKAKQEQEQSPTRAAKADTRKYCIDTEATGSRILKRDCRTRSEWLDLGVDPLEVMKQR